MPLAPYLGDPSLVNSNTAYVLPALPQNPETANATTVTDPLKICVDDIHYLAKQMSAYRPHIQMTADPDKIIISPFSSVSIFDGVKWFFLGKTNNTTLTVANKEGGGTFTPGIFYYIYLKADTSIILSTDIPDSPLLFKNSGVGPTANQYRYLGKAIALNATQFYAFQMVDFRYTMSYPLNTNFSTSFFQPAINVDTDLGITAAPGTVRFLMQLYSDTDQADALGNCMYISIRASGLVVNSGTFTGFGVPRGHVGGQFIAGHYVTVDVPVNTSTGQVVATLKDLQGTATTANSKIKIWWIGFQE